MSQEQFKGCSSSTAHFFPEMQIYQYLSLYNSVLCISQQDLSLL